MQSFARRVIAAVTASVLVAVVGATTPFMTATPAAAATQGSVRMDGVSSLIAVPDNAALRLATNFTLEARVKPLETTRQTTMLGKSYYELSIFPAAGGIQFAFVIRQGAWRVVKGPVLPIGSWHSVAGSYDGSFMRLFVDGELVASSGLTGRVETSTRPFYIGSVEGRNDIFNGLIDEVRVSNVVRYTSSYVGTSQPFTTDGSTVGLWHLDEGTGSVAADSSGRGNNGTLQNGVAWSADSPFSNPDTVPPVVTGMGSTAVRGRTATVRWTTSEPASSQVEYGPTTSYGSSTKLDPAWITAHAVGIGGLTPSTTYHYRVISRDLSGNTSSSPDGTFTTASGTSAAQDIGQWAPAVDWPLVAVHQVQLHTGEILMYDAWEIPARPRVWNPATNVFTDVPVPAGVFCSGHAALPDGKILVVGGHQAGEVGIPDAFLFDPVTRAFTRLPSMSQARWYPTATPLPDGKVLILSGMITGTTWADTPELFDPATNTFTRLTGITTSDIHETEYPQSFLMPDGRVLAVAPSSGQARLIDAGRQTYTQLAPTQVFGGSGLMVRPGTFLLTGGGDVSSAGEAQSRAQIIDMTAPSPRWRDVNAMREIRFMHNPVMLADGTAMIIGGSSIADQAAKPGTVTPEIWDPDTEAFTPVAQHRDKRMYHSTAMLLPDGRVLAAGGGKLAPAADFRTAEIYSPPYLFRGERPVVTAAPPTMRYGQPATLTSPQASTITRAHLVRLASVTHTIDQDQHFVPLTVRSSGSSVTVDAPSAAGVAPPGYYMLFLVNGNGVPSEARTVHLSSSPSADRTGPAVSIAAPAGGATVSGTVNVTASAGDDVGVTSVQFQLDGANLGGTDAAAPYTVAWDTVTAKAGAHTLRAVAKDAAGNTTTSAPVTVSVDNSAPDRTAPVISGVHARTVSKTAAQIAWTTDEASASQVDWGTTTAYGSTTPLDTARVTEHAVNLSGLAEDTTYHVRVRSRDAAGNESVSGDMTFRTNAAFGCTMHLPANGSTVSGTVPVEAGIKGGFGPFSVQFMVDGTSTGPPDTAPPYTLAWDSRTVADGSHTVGSVATDSRGDIVNASAVMVKVANGVPRPAPRAPTTRAP